MSGEFTAKEVDTKEVEVAAEQDQCGAIISMRWDIYIGIVCTLEGQDLVTAGPWVILLKTVRTYWISGRLERGRRMLTWLALSLDLFEEIEAHGREILFLVP